MLIQSAAITNLAMLANGALYYNTPALPAKPAGVTITDVAVYGSFNNAWATAGPLSSWNAFIYSTTNAAQNGRITVMALGTKP